MSGLVGNPGDSCSHVHNERIFQFVCMYTVEKLMFDVLKWSLIENIRLAVTRAELVSFNRTHLFLLFFFNSGPFYDNFTHIETCQSVGGAKGKYPGKTT